MKQKFRWLSSSKQFRVANLIVVLIAVSVTGLALLSSGKAATVYVIPAAIPNKATCDENLPDVSNEIFEWLKTVPSGSTAQLLPNTCYRTESEVPIVSKTNFIFDGNGSRFQAFTDGCDSQDPNPTDDKDPYDHCKYIQTSPSCHPAGKKCERPGWPQMRRRIDVGAARNLVIKNLRLDGGHPNPGADGTYSGALAFQHGINFSQTNEGVVVENVEIDRVWGDYIYISGTAKNITIQNNKFGEMAGSDKHGTGRQGIGMVSGENIVIKGNRILEVRRTVVDIEPLSSNAVIKDFYFDDNYIGDHGLNFFSNHNYGDADPVIEGVYFRNNVHAAKRFAIDSVANMAPINPSDPATYKRKNYQFINNRSTGSDASGNCGDPSRYMKLWGIDGVIVKDTDSRVNAGRCMTLVEGNKLRNVKVTGNKTLNALRTAVDYTNSVNVCERDNYVGNPFTLDPIHPKATQCPPDEPPPPVDSTPPSKPTNSSATLEGEKTVKLSWDASTDDNGVTEYHVYRKFAFTTTSNRIATVIATNYTDTTAQQGRTYVYQISAVDSAGNESEKSDNASIAIPAPPGQTFKPGDINQDGVVNLLDFSALSVKFGQSTDLGRADINSDGTCNLLDFSLLMIDYGT